MKTHYSLTLHLLLGSLLLSLSANAQSLLPNGSFDDPSDPLKGWVTDYEWTGNSYYIANKDFVHVEQDGTRKNIVKLVSPGDGGVKIESIPIKLEPGFRYTCTLDVKGGPYRLYFSGYRWAPGVPPNDNPILADLRPIYKSKAVTGKSPDWTKVTFELPGVKLSEQALSHLKHVRFITIYLWFLKGSDLVIGTQKEAAKNNDTASYIDNVTLTKTPDESMNF
jgi:hypothetical protein